MSIITPRVAYGPFEYQEAYNYWLRQQTAHWMHCVGPDQRVFTNKGLKTVLELYNSKEPLTIFNGKEWVKTTPMLLTGHRDIYEIITKEGYKHKVTKDHRVMTQRGWVEAKDLIVGDELLLNNVPNNFGQVHEPELAFLSGHYQGDGTTTKTGIILQVWGEEKKLIPIIENKIKIVYDKFSLKKTTYPRFHKKNTEKFSYRIFSSGLLKTDAFCKNKIPDIVWNGTQETILEYLKGLFYTDGTAYQNKKHACIKFAQINKSFIEEVQLLLLTLGIKSYIRESKKRNTILPDGKGGKKEYNCQPIYILEITQKDSVLFLNEKIKLFEHKNKKLRSFINRKKSHPIRNAKFKCLNFIGKSDVFCVSVFSDHKAWLCNGFITHNTEVQMASDVNDWKLNLTEEERYLLGSTLKGFVQSEIFIEDYWSSRVGRWFKKPEIQMMAHSFGAFESIHAVSYSYLEETLGIQDYSSFLSEPTAKDKIDRLINTGGKSKEDIALSLAVFSAFNEGVNLFSSFAILGSFSQRNLMKGVGKIIEFSAKDESLHSEAGCWLFRTFVSEFPELLNDELKRKIYDAARLTIQLEDAFIDKAFERGDLPNLTAKDLKNYIRYRANTKLQDLGLKSNWKSIDKEALSRLEWFNVMVSGTSIQDFFAGRETSYAKGVALFDEVW